MITDEERKLLMHRTCECMARSGCKEARRVELIETHISYVILTGQFAYKI